MPIEIDETQLASLQKTAKSVQAMLKNPKTRMQVLQAYKENHPDEAVPELDAAAPYTERMNRLETAVIDFMKKQEEDREKDKIETRLEEIRRQAERGREILKSRGYTEDGIKAIEEFRDKKGLVDYDDAISLWELNNPAPAVAEPEGMDFFGLRSSDDDGNDFHKKLFDSLGEDNSAVERMALQSIREMRGGNRR